jgi:hypothetical protein
MPRIFDNIEFPLLPVLRDTLSISKHADFCVGYFNLRGWKSVDTCVEKWKGGEGNCCRLLVGMHRAEKEQIRVALQLDAPTDQIDNQTAIQKKKELAEQFKEQLTIGCPTNADEAGLRKLAKQIKQKKLVVKLFLRHPLHAKLYLCFRNDPNNPITGFLGSSNLTMSGLARQGELNVDVLDHDATEKLALWFDDRWNDRWCIDISDELVEVIESSWASETVVPPYHVYLKIAYHLSQDARAGLAEFRVPREFREILFPFQEAAVRIAAHHLNKRNGVLIGDVVGLGKTLMATALARIFEDDFGHSTLIICPKNLVPMWQYHVDHYGLRGKVLSSSKVLTELKNVPARFRLLVIDESHNLRNREGKIYRAIHEHIGQSDSKCILLTATPYNKTYLDLSNQLRLFVPLESDIGIRPERYLSDVGEVEFIRRHQCPIRSLAAFEKSDYADDWRDLMRLYLVRRTRSFIQNHYAKDDPVNGRKYLEFADGTRNYFPFRRPKTAAFEINDNDPNDQYAQLYDQRIVNRINRMELPRYGLANYVIPTPSHPPTQTEGRQLDDLSRAGKRLMGFCRTNLFKRLESSGVAFIQSVERHVLRNYVFLHAIENDLPIPIGSQGAELLDARLNDEDSDGQLGDLFESPEEKPSTSTAPRTDDDFRQRAEEVYGLYAGQFKRRFSWLRSELFTEQLATDLLKDSKSLIRVLETGGKWDPRRDNKLLALHNLIAERHFTDKILVFSQFADTVRYLETELKEKGVEQMEAVCGGHRNPTEAAWRFSPVSNGQRDNIDTADELRVLIATDVLSEGQNLQDCAIVVNFDLPWAIIRIIQRAGRVDRIGQKSEEILCYSFLPAEGVERIINLRGRVRQRLQENAEVVGTDEAFFEDDRNDQVVRDLFTERDGILDDEGDSEVDLSSQAYEIWNNAIEANPAVEKIIAELPDVVYSTKPNQEDDSHPHGVLAYLRTAHDTDALTWINRDGKTVSESQLRILRAAKCEPDTPALTRHEQHHELVAHAIEHAAEEEKSIGGQLGRPSGARFKTYERLKSYANEMEGTLFDTQTVQNVRKATEEIFRYPLRQMATDILNRQLRSGIDDEDLATLVVALRDDDNLCIITEYGGLSEPRISCSLGLTDH